MRLSFKQIQQIKHHIYNIYGGNASVYYFGSRVNDAEKDGDVDLLIEVDTKELASFEHTFKLTGTLLLALGPKKIDFISHVKGQPANKIQQQAL